MFAADWAGSYAGVPSLVNNSIDTWLEIGIQDQSVCLSVILSLMLCFDTTDKYLEYADKNAVFAHGM